MVGLVGIREIALLLSVISPALAFAAPVDLIAREILFGDPDRSQVHISPDGRSISYLAAHQGALNVFVQTIGQDDARAVTTIENGGIESYLWLHNGQQIVYQHSLTLHLHAVDIATGQDVDLTPVETIKPRLLARDRGFPEEVLVAINDRDPHAHDCWRINTRTGERTLVLRNDEGFNEFFTAGSFKILLASKVNQRTGGIDVFARPADEQPWYELTRWAAEDAESSRPIGLSRDGNAAYLIDSRGRDTSALFRCNIADPARPAYEMLAEEVHADVGEVLLDSTTGKPQAVMFEYGRREWQVLDPAIQADWKILKQLLDGDISIVSRSDNDLRWIVRVIDDDRPTSFHHYDRRQKQATLLFSQHAALEVSELAAMAPVAINSRDGLKLVSYLTLPPRGPSRDLPMILLVHDGPWDRDRWGYDPTHQWLANRGYAVLSVNYRGSRGFGKKFLNAGNREWAGKMHTDLIDAVNWAVQQKIADPDRVAIMGSGFGGYASVTGLTLAPEFFAAGVNMHGAVHVRTLLQSFPGSIPELTKARVGSLDEPTFLEQISPLPRAASIRKRLLIANGSNDSRLQRSEIQQIVSVMQEREIPVTWVTFADEGSDFKSRANRLAAYAVAEAFLAQHLGGAYESDSGALDRSTAQIEAGAEHIPNLLKSAPEE